MTLKKITITDIVALILIIGAFFFLWFNRDGTFSGILTLIVGYYFGKKSSHMPDVPLNEKIPEL